MERKINEEPDELKTNESKAIEEPDWELIMLETDYMRGIGDFYE